VLKGDMSLVGPRPPLAYEAKLYQSWHLRRILVIRPGITGLWQVEGRSRVTFDEMVRMDLRYIKQRSLALDLKLLVRTVSVVVARQGAK
jgi:lipopolysaccharide/colanic/teichoic acid biosynthesis glycosyltransferase